MMMHTGVRWYKTTQRLFSSADVSISICRLMNEAVPGNPTGFYGNHSGGLGEMPSSGGPGLASKQTNEMDVASAHGATEYVEQCLSPGLRGMGLGAATAPAATFQAQGKRSMQDVDWSPAPVRVPRAPGLGELLSSQTPSAVGLAGVRVHAATLMGPARTAMPAVPVEGTFAAVPAPPLQAAQAASGPPTGLAAPPQGLGLSLTAQRGRRGTRGGAKGSKGRGADA